MKNNPSFTPAKLGFVLMILQAYWKRILLRRNSLTFRRAHLGSGKQLPPMQKCRNVYVYVYMSFRLAEVYAACGSVSLEMSDEQ